MKTGTDAEKRPKSEVSRFLSKPNDARFLTIGVATALLFMLGERLDSYYVTLIFKPIPIWCLMAWVIWNAKSSSWFRRFVVIGLAFGSLGDILLCLKHKDAFLHGLGAFLVGHIFYVIAFRYVSTERRLLHQTLHWIPYALWGASAVIHIHMNANLGPFLLPISIYTMVLSMCCWQASLAAVDRIAHDQIPSHFKFVQRYAPVIGAAMFTMSDMMIAFQKFIPNFYSSSTTRMIYMILYYVGQWAIAYSTLERKGSAKYWKSEEALKQLETRRAKKNQLKKDQ